MRPPSFVADGFEIHPPLLDGAACDVLLASLASVSRSRAGARHLMSVAAVSGVANDPRLLAVAADALGGRAVPFRATLFDKSRQANWLVAWHQDTALPLASRFEDPGWGPWSEKAGVLYAHAPTWALRRVVALRLHLDASTEDNGPLRMVPGSHRQGVRTDDDVREIAMREPAVEAVVARGGVLSMSPLLIHASSKSRSGAPRRVLHVEYADAIGLDEMVVLAIA